MKVLQLVTQLEPAGAQTVAYALERELPTILKSAQVDTRFFYLKAGSRLFSAERCLYATRPRTVADLLRLAVRLVGVLRRRDVIIAHTHYAILVAIVVSLVLRDATVIAVHHWPVSRYPRPVRLALRLGGARVEHVSVAEGLIDWRFRGSSSASVIPNPIPVIDFSGAVESVDILIVARHAPEKGIALAIEAISQMPGRHLVLVGGGPETDELRALANRLHAPTTFLGRLDQDRVVALMRGARTVLLPSYWEALPMVVLEAVACDSDLVLSDIPAHRPFIDLGLALGFRCGDVPDLVRVLSSELGGAQSATMRSARQLYRVTHPARGTYRAWADLLSGGRNP